MVKLGTLRRELREMGCVSRPGKGSHEVWEHPLQRQRVVLSGLNGDDAMPYQVSKVRQFRRGTMVYKSCAFD